MRMKPVGVVIGGVVSWHMPHHTGNYNTLCGIDADDPQIGHTGTVEPQRGQKIDCDDCLGMWETSRRFNRSDFCRAKAQTTGAEPADGSGGV